MGLWTGRQPNVKIVNPNDTIQSTGISFPNSIETLESSQQQNVGDSTLNAFYLELFSRIRTLQDEVDRLQRCINGIDLLVEDRFNSDSRKFKS